MAASTTSSSRHRKEVRLTEDVLFTVEALVQMTHVSGGTERQGIDHDHFHHRPTTASTFRPPTTTSLQHDGGGKMAIMHPDTTILMVSCAFMIIIGEETNS